MGSTWDVHRCDALRWLMEYDGPLFDALITDPPYSSGGRSGDGGDARDDAPVRVGCRCRQLRVGGSRSVEQHGSSSGS